MNETVCQYYKHTVDKTAVPTPCIFNCQNKSLLSIAWLCLVVMDAEEYGKTYIVYAIDDISYQVV